MNLSKKNRAAIERVVYDAVFSSGASIDLYADLARHIEVGGEEEKVREFAAALFNRITLLLGRGDPIGVCQHVHSNGNKCGADVWLEDLDVLHCIRHHPSK